MTQQGQLFDLGHPDTPPLARRTDPHTSHRAAEEIRPAVSRLEKWASMMVAQNPGHTAMELARLLKLADPRMIGRRLCGAERKGLIRRGKARVCQETGRTAFEWYPA